MVHLSVWDLKATMLVWPVGPAWYSAQLQLTTHKQMESYLI